MPDVDKVQPEVLLELHQLKQRLAQLEAKERDYKRAEREYKDNLAELELAYRQANIYARELADQMRQFRQAQAEILNRNRELDLLNRIIAASAVNLDPKAILEITCRELANTFDVFQVHALLFSHNRQIATVVAEHPQGRHNSLLNNRYVIPHNPLLKNLLRRNQETVIDNVQQDARLNEGEALFRRAGVQSALIVPVVENKHTLALLCLSIKAEQTFSDEIIPLTQSVARQVSGVLVRARLFAESQRLSTAIDQATESVVIIDRRRCIIYVNPAFEAISGYSEAEAMGRNLFALMRHEDRESMDDIWRLVEAGQAWHGRLTSHCKDGTTFIEDASITPVRDNEGQIMHFVVVKRDVTREIQLEEQYQQAQKMEAVGRLTAGIAHDFNNLLTGINGFAELLDLSLSQDDPLREFVESIRYSGGRAATLIRQLLAFSRKQVIELEVLNLNQIIQNLGPLLERISGPSITLDTSNLSPNLWSISADPSQIEQVVVNLVVNAHDAMSDADEGTLRLITDNVQVADKSPLALPPGEYVRLSVADTGTGMSESVKARLFEPFFTTKDKGKGTGLGLSTVLGIVEQSQGHIRVNSVLNQGTRFDIYLPRVAQAARRMAQTAETGPVPEGTETILLVEDEQTVRSLARHILQRQGYTVLEAVDGEDALQYLRHSVDNIDLLLTDLVMPNISGQELAQNFRAAAPDIAVLFTSGYTEEAIMADPDSDLAFIQKPFTAIELANRVRDVLDKASS